MDRQEYELELAEQKFQEIKDLGYKSFRDYDNARQYEQASREYEQQLNCPFG